MGVKSTAPAVTLHKMYSICQQINTDTTVQNQVGTTVEHGRKLKSLTRRALLFLHNTGCLGWS